MQTDTVSDRGTVDSTRTTQPFWLKVLGVSVHCLTEHIVPYPPHAFTELNAGTVYQSIQKKGRTPIPPVHGSGARSSIAPLREPEAT